MIRQKEGGRTMVAVDQAVKQEVLQRTYSLGYEYEQKYGCCSQCTLAAIQDVFGFPGDEVIKASHVLAGGGALTTRGTCGALAGGMMAISGKYGRPRKEFASGLYMHAFRLGKELFDRFVAEFGSPICADVQRRMCGRSFDLWDPEEFEAFEAAGAHRDKCPTVVGTAARLAAEVLLEAEAKEQEAGGK
jgi:C_GCAxxG_C_C family probable redox protein